MGKLQLNDIHTYYGGVHALKGVTLHIDEGEIVTLIGSNGAGKSTTLKTISRQVKLKSGTIFYNNKEISMLSPHEVFSLGIAHVPEGRRIFSRLTVKENLEMGAFIVKDKNVKNERMEKVFHYFPKLKDRLDQMGGTMSGGEQQMLAIARALMSSPKILLLDEPSMGLAPIVVEQIFEIIQELNKTGMTILLVEQNAFQALQLANRGYVIQTGTIQLSGKGHDLLIDDGVKELYLA